MQDTTDAGKLAAREQGFEVIYEAVHGSQAFGLAGPDSDLDIKGIIIGPADWYHGFGEDACSEWLIALRLKPVSG